MKSLKILLSTVLFLLLGSTANAVTLVAGHSYQLTGNVYGASTVAGTTGLYSLTPAGSYSFFTYNADKTIDVVLNLIMANGTRATLIMNDIVVGGTGSALTMSAAAGATNFVHASTNYKDVGNFLPAANPSAFSNFAIAMNGQLNTLANTFKFWGKYFSQTGSFLYGQTDFHLNIGSDVTTQVPEPLTLSLLGMGLLGGVISRKKRATK